MNGEDSPWDGSANSSNEKWRGLPVRAVRSLMQYAECDGLTP